MLRATAIGGKSRRGKFSVVLYEVAESPAGTLVWREIGRAVCGSFGEALDHASNEWVDYPTLDITADGEAVSESQAMRLTGLTNGMAALDRLRDELAGE
jgi:hypothetical protein